MTVECSQEFRVLLLRSRSVASATRDSSASPAAPGRRGQIDEAKALEDELRQLLVYAEPDFYILDRLDRLADRAIPGGLDSGS